MNPYIQLPRVAMVGGRHQFILDRCRGKRVLHLGCVDAGLLHERFARQELMHQRLAAVSVALWGVDVDAGGIDFLRRQGFSNLITGDMGDQATVDALRGMTFDLIVASEVVEHLQNPGLFLSAVKQVMTPGTTEFIMTVPNAFRIDTLLWLIRGVEFVHPDHNYWFSYQTATNLLRKNNFDVTQVLVYSLQPLTILPSRKPLRARALGNRATAVASDPAGSRTASRGGTFTTLVSYAKSLPKRLLVAFLYRRSPFWGDGLILLAQLGPQGE